MYGLVNNIIAVEGRRDALIGILLENARDMPGCLSYVVAADVDDPNAAWVTEVWDDQAAQQASLELASVKDAIKRAGPAIAAFKSRTITMPVGGMGLPQR